MDLLTFICKCCGYTKTATLHILLHAALIMRWTRVLMVYEAIESACCTHDLITILKHTLYSSDDITAATDPFGCISRKSFLQQNGNGSWRRIVCRVSQRCYACAATGLASTSSPPAPPMHITKQNIKLPVNRRAGDCLVAFPCHS
jgi:hypothetical protein